MEPILTLPDLIFGPLFVWSRPIMTRYDFPGARQLILINVWTFKYGKYRNWFELIPTLPKYIFGQMSMWIVENAFHVNMSIYTCI